MEQAEPIARLLGDTLGQSVVVTPAPGWEKARLFWRCGAQGGEILPQPGSTDFIWVPPVELAGQQPESSRILVRLELRKGSAGRRYGKTLLLGLPGQLQPGVKLTWEDARGYAQHYGAPVQNLSRLVLSARATGTQGAAIESCGLGCGSLESEGSRGVFPLPQAGKTRLRAWARDRRGRRAEMSLNVEVLAYSRPTGGIRSREAGEQGLLVRCFARVSPLKGRNPGRITLRHRDSEGKVYTLRLKDAWEVDGSFLLPGAGLPGQTELEVADDFETAVFPYTPDPLLEIDTRERALGIGSRADRPGTVCLGLGVDMAGMPLENLPPPRQPGDGLSLGQAEARFWQLPRLVWQNPAPEVAFAPQTVAVEPGWLLIRAADTAGQAGYFWEIGLDSGLLRGQGCARPFSRENGSLVFGTTALGDDRAVPLEIYTLGKGEEA